MDLLDKIKEDLKVIFESDIDRYNHILGVVEMSIHLALFCNDIEINKVVIAAYLHDVTKNFKKSEHLNYITKEEFEAFDTKVLVHSYSAAKYAQICYNIEDEDILQAIRSHVYGNLNMTIYDKILLISDFCERGRTYPFCIEVRQVAINGDIDLALQMTLGRTVKSLVQRGITPTNEQLEICRKYGADIWKD